MPLPYDLPTLVKVLCANHGGWIVGSQAKRILGIVDTARDWDVIVPLGEWLKVALLIPKGTKSNTFGGFKVREGDAEIDVWVSDVGSHFAQAPLDGEVAVSPFRGIWVEKKKLSDVTDDGKNVLPS